METIGGIMALFSVVVLCYVILLFVKFIITQEDKYQDRIFFWTVILIFNWALSIMIL